MPDEPDNPDRLESIFSAALALPPRERPAFLADKCASDDPLHQRIEALLRAYDAPEGFLREQASVARMRTPTVADFLAGCLTEQPGDTIGRYKLLEKLGEGGYGVVYMAEQEQPVRRRVALKVIKLGMDTRQVVAR